MSIKNIKESTLEDLIHKLSQKEILMFNVLLGNRSIELLEQQKATELVSKSSIIKGFQ